MAQDGTAIGGSAPMATTTAVGTTKPADAGEKKPCVRRNSGRIVVPAHCRAANREGGLTTPAVAPYVTEVRTAVAEVAAVMAEVAVVKPPTSPRIVLVFFDTPVPSRSQADGIFLW
jgi:hypothetical protein